MRGYHKHTKITATLGPATATFGGMPTKARPGSQALELVEPQAKMLRAAAVLAQELGNSGIVVFTRSGSLADTVTALKDVGVPIYAFTDDEVVFRQRLLPWGVEPFLMPFSEDPEDTIKNALAYLARRQRCSDNTWLVVITNALAHDRFVNTLQLRQVPPGSSKAADDVAVRPELG